MKKCPNCGFVPTLSNRKLVKFFATHFPDLPVWEMIQRGWIRCGVYSQWGDRSEWAENEAPQMLRTICDELCRFFEVETDEELAALMKWEGGLMDK